MKILNVNLLFSTIIAAENIRYILEKSLYFALVLMLSVTYSIVTFAGDCGPGPKTVTIYYVGNINYPLHGSVFDFADEVTRLTDGSLTVNVDNIRNLTGLPPGRDTLNRLADSSDPLRMYFSPSPGFRVGTTAIGGALGHILVSGVPFGLHADEFFGWYYEGGGKDAIQDALDLHLANSSVVGNVLFLAGSMTSGESTGLFDFEIKKLSDFEGKSYVINLLGTEIMRNVLSNNKINDNYYFAGDTSHGVIDALAPGNFNTFIADPSQSRVISGNVNTIAQRICGLDAALNPLVGQDTIFKIDGIERGPIVTLKVIGLDEYGNASPNSLAIVPKETVVSCLGKSSDDNTVHFYLSDWQQPYLLDIIGINEGWYNTCLNDAERGAIEAAARSTVLKSYAVDLNQSKEALQAFIDAANDAGVTLDLHEGLPRPVLEELRDETVKVLNQHAVPGSPFKVVLDSYREYAKGHDFINTFDGVPKTERYNLWETPEDWTPDFFLIPTKFIGP